MKQTEFTSALLAEQSAFGLLLDDEQITRLEVFHSLILEHNPVLHLVGPCSDTEFAVRHILESLTLLKHLPMEATVTDIGAGAGLPSLPCLLVRKGLNAVLIESKEKKVKFLEDAIDRLGLVGRVRVVHNQFEETDAAEARFVTCRALDKFTKKLPRLLRWSGDRGLLFFGGENLAAALQANRVKFVQELMPLSEKRYLFVRK